MSDGIRSVHCSPAARSKSWSSFTPSRPGTIWIGFTSSACDLPARENGDAMSKYHTHDGGKLKPAQIARLDELEARLGDDDVYPPAPDANWATAVRGRFYKPRNEAISLRVDMDVLEWLRRQGPGYQTGINRILRDKRL